MGAENVIEVRGVTKSFRIPAGRRETLREHALALFRPRPYRQLRVLDGLDLDLRRGEALGIMGRNGCGKSTLLKILTGIYRPDGGTVTVRGAVTAILELGVGWNPELDAVDNVELLGTALGLTLAEVRAARDEILAFAGIEDFAQLELKHYSSGMAVRLAYAVAYHAVREILILDEVFAVGDVAFRQACHQRFRDLHAAGHSSILVSHDHREIRNFCDRALLLEDGCIVREGTGPEIAEAYLELLDASEEEREEEW